MPSRICASSLAAYPRTRPWPASACRWYLDRGATFTPRSSAAAATARSSRPPCKNPTIWMPASPAAKDAPPFAQWRDRDCFARVSRPRWPAGRASLGSAPGAACATVTRGFTIQEWCVAGVRRLRSRGCQGPARQSCGLRRATCGRSLALRAAPGAGRNRLPDS